MKEKKKKQRENEEGVRSQGVKKRLVHILWCITKTKQNDKKAPRNPDLPPPMIPAGTLITLADPGLASHWLLLD